MNIMLVKWRQVLWSKETSIEPATDMEKGKKVATRKEHKELCIIDNKQIFGCIDTKSVQ